MSEVTKTYVEFLYPGALFVEEEVKEVNDRDVKKILKIMPKGAFCFRIYDQTSKETKVDGETRTVFGKEKNKTGKYYPGGRSYNLAEIKKMGKDYSILASNMECNDWPIVVRSRAGNFQPFEKGDIIL